MPERILLRKPEFGNFAKRCRVTEHPFFGQVRVTTKQILISTTTCRDIRNSSLHSRFARPRLSKHASFQCHSLSQLGNRSFLDSLLSFLSEMEWCSLWHPEKAKTRTLCQVTSLLKPTQADSSRLKPTQAFKIPDTAWYCPFPQLEATCHGQRMKICLSPRAQKVPWLSTLHQTTLCQIFQVWISPVRWVKLWGKTYVETLVIGKRAVAPDTSKDEPITKSTYSWSIMIHIEGFKKLSGA